LLRFKLYFSYEVFGEIPIKDLYNRIALKILYSSSTAKFLQMLPVYEQSFI